MRHVVTKARVDKKKRPSRGPGDKHARKGVPGHYFSPESILREASCISEA